MKKKLLLILVSLFVFSAYSLPLLAQETAPDCTLPAGVEATYEAYLQLGDVARAGADYLQAVADYTCAIQLDPSQPLAYSNRGKLYLDFLGNYGQAVDDYSRVLELTPGNAIAYNNRGWAYFKLAQYQDAISSYNRAVQVDPQYALAYNNRAVANIYLRRYDRAVSDLQTALDLGFEREQWIYNNFGVAYAGLGMLEEALDSLQNAIRIDPTYAEPYYWLADVYNSLQQYGKALDYAEKHVELAGDQADSRALNLIETLEKPSEFVRLLPVLLIGLILALVIIGSVLPDIRRRRAEVTVDPTNAEPEYPSMLGEPLQVDTVDLPPPPSRKRTLSPAVIVLPVVTAAVGAIVYAMRKMGQTPDE